MRRFAFNLASDAVIFACFYLWQVKHIEAAHTFLQFVLWTFAALLVIGVFAVKDKRSTQRPFPYAVVGYTCTAAQVALMVWTGMTALAVTYFIAWVLILSQITDKKVPA